MNSGVISKCLSLQKIIGATTNWRPLNWRLVKGVWKNTNVHILNSLKRLI